MSCFNCDSDSCLNLDDLARCANGIEIDPTWIGSVTTGVDFKVVYSFNGSQYDLEFNIPKGDPILIPAGDLPKDYVLEFYVLDGNNVRMQTEVNSVTYDCFTIKLSI